MRHIYLFLAVGLFFFHFLGTIFLNNNNGGQFEPHAVSFDQLIAEGPGSNRLVTLDDFVIEDGCQTYGEYPSLILPIFATEETARDKSPVQAVIHFAGVFDQQDVDAMLVQLETQPMTGMASWDPDVAYYDDILAELYPEKQNACSLIWHVGDKPSVLSTVVAYGILLAGVLMGFLAALALCQTYSVPKTPATQLLLVLLGGGLLSAAGYWRFTLAGQVFGPELLIATTAAQSIASFGLGAIVCSLLAWVCGESMFDGSWYGDAVVAIDENGNVNLTKGSKTERVPFEEIQYLTFYITENDPNSRDLFVIQIDCFDNTNQRITGILTDTRRSELTPQIDRLIQKIAQRDIERIKNGEAISNEQWTVSGDCLSVKQPKSSRNLEIRLSQIETVKLVSSEIRIWADGQPRHLAAVDTKHKHSLVIAQILHHFVDLAHSELSVASTSTEPVAASSQKDDNKILFEEVQNHLSTWLISLGSILAGGALAAFIYMYTGNVEGAGLLGFSLAGCGVSLGIFTRMGGNTGKKEFRIFPNAISMTHNGQETRFQYDQLASVSRGVTNVYVNGAYSGSYQEFEFVGDDRRISKYRTDKKDSIFDEMIDRASEGVALKMAAELSEVDSIQWTPTTRIHKLGIELPVRSGLRTAYQVIDWEGINGIQFADGKAHVFAQDKPKAIATIDCKEANFFPGLHLIEQLLQLHNQSAMVEAYPGDQELAPAAV